MKRQTRLLLRGFVIYLATLNVQSSFPTTETISLHSACYGTHTKFQPSCLNFTETVIGIKDVKVGVKMTSDNCPDIIVEGITVNRSLYYIDRTTPFTDLWCCAWNLTNDCVFTYNSSITDVDYKFQNRCTGLSECNTPIVVPRSPSRNGNCSNTMYMDNTNYMVMEYACVNKSRIISQFQTAENRSVDGKALYIQSSEYPNKTSTDSFSCSVQADICDSGINLYILDIRMTNESGHCNQTFAVIGSGFNQSWSCDYSSLFVVTTYHAPDRYLNVTFTGGAANGADESLIWVGFEAQDATATLTVSCPPASQVTCADPIQSTPESTTSQDATATLAVSCPPASQVTCAGPSQSTPESTTGSTEDGSSDNSVVVPVVVSLVLLLLLLLLLLFCCYRKRWCCFKNRRVYPEDKNNQGDDSDDANVLNSRHMAPVLAPANTMFDRRNTSLFKSLHQSKNFLPPTDPLLEGKSNRLPPLATHGLNGDAMAKTTASDQNDPPVTKKKRKKKKTMNDEYGDKVQIVAENESNDKSEKVKKKKKKKMKRQVKKDKNNGESFA